MAKSHRVDLDRLDQQLTEAVKPTAGFSADAVEHFRTFVREGKFQVDNRDVDADAFFWLDPLYDMKRSSLLGVRLRDGTWMQRPDPKYSEGIVLRKASQGGATVFSILFLVWLCIDPRRGVNVGCFWPNEDDVVDFVQMRFVPLLESSEKMQFYIKESRVNNTRSKEIGLSALWFRYVNGSSKTDSVPLDIIVGDEVRLWGDPKRVADLMQRMEERFGQSEIRLKIWMSTVGSPGDAMEKLWEGSNQVKYFSACPSGCVTEIREKAEDPEDRVVPADERHTIREGAMVVEGVCLSDWHPHQITKAREGRDADWCCPCCHATIYDTKEGPGFVETFPEASGMYGLEFARTLYRTVSPFKLRREHDHATDKKQFWNGWMAKPYRDPAGAIIKPEHIDMARSDSRVQWHLTKPAGMDTYLGADFRTDEIHVVVLGLSGEEEDGTMRGQILHVEVMQDGEEAYTRLEKMLFDFGVTCAIIDYRPHTTTTLAMARRNETRLYLASYVQGEMIRLKKGNTVGSRAAEDDVRETNIVLLDQTKSLKYSMQSFAMGNWKASPEPLEQLNFYDRKRALHPVYDVAWEFFDHLPRQALTHIPKTTKNASGEVVGASAAFDEKFVDVGYDPHFAHAFNYAVMATRLNPGGARLIGGGVTKPSLTNPLALAAPRPSTVDDKRCGNCHWWQGSDEGNALGMCEAGWGKTTAMQPPCPSRLWRRKKAQKV